MTTTQQMSGVPPIPPDVLAKMSPEQRAHIEQMMQKNGAGGPSTRTTQVCLTQKKLSKDPFGDERKNCERTIISSTSTRTQFHEECTEPNGAKQIADGKFELSGTSTVRGSVQAKVLNGPNKMIVNVDVAGKWIGPDCAAAK